MTEVKSAFRPSSISRYVNCNLWRWLPFENKTPEQLKYLQARTDDHTRLEQEQFNDKESECKAYFDGVKSRCIYFFKEQHLEMEIGGEFLEGTPDVYGYDENAKTLHILDYKTGRSYVLAENNDQLLAYALLAINRHDDWPIEKIELSILNTQHDGVSHHVYMSTSYLDALKKKIEQGIEKNNLEESFGRPGSWCQFCPSKRYCFRKKDYNALKSYADIDTDHFILESKKRRAEVAAREKDIKEGKFSKLLTPFLVEKTTSTWKESLPNHLYELKPMTITSARKKFSEDELEGFIETKKTVSFKVAT